MQHPHGVQIERWCERLPCADVLPLQLLQEHQGQAAPLIVPADVEDFAAANGVRDQIATLDSRH